MNKQSKQNSLFVKAPYDFDDHLDLMLMFGDKKDKYGHFQINNDGKVYESNEKNELLNKEITDSDILYSVYVNNNYQADQKDFDGVKRLGESLNNKRADVIINRLKEYENNNNIFSYEYAEIYTLLGKDSDGEDHAKDYIYQLSIMVKDIMIKKDTNQIEALQNVIIAHLHNKECLGDLFGQVSEIDSDIRKKYLNSLAQVMADEIITNNTKELDKAYSENGQSEWEKISYQNVHWQEGIFNHLLDQYHINDIPKKPTKYFDTISKIATPFIKKALENINDDTKKRAIQNIATNYDISQLNKGLEKIKLQSILPEDDTRYPTEAKKINKIIHDGLVIGLDKQFTDLPDTLVGDAKQNGFLKEGLQALQKQNEQNRQATLANLHAVFGETKVVQDSSRPNTYHIWNPESLLNQSVCGNEKLLFNHDLIATIADDGKLFISIRDEFWSKGLTESQMSELKVEQNGNNYIPRKVNNDTHNVLFNM